ncbi:DUF4133 domain-containing protein [Pedobacter xixiisoli]|uniref:DUF4133 domain-containing protein n=1 Tax=Pedobacter xixiisoli TaxID=1476464 RepID=A0A286A6X9_9SPHI|nr:DUF4133 domain-containing protein [Pedobacter xixiisoli]SOD17683.1 protein of unknown function [Pedobacter xixiisoli]
MQTSLYEINKGINKSIEFKGLKAQYIWYMGTGALGLLILFAILYIIGIPSLVCLMTVAILAGVLLSKVYAMSNKYGEHGLMKALARKQVPKVIKINSRSIFINKKALKDD